MVEYTMIRKVKNKEEWKLYSKDGKKVLGTFKSREKAEKRERVIQFFKRK